MSGFVNSQMDAFVIAAVLLIGVFAYARALGTEDVMKVATR